MNASTILRQIAEVVERYGDVPVKVYNTDYASCEDTPGWEIADIEEIRVDGMQIEVWV